MHGRGVNLCTTCSRVCVCVCVWETGGRIQEALCVFSLWRSRLRDSGLKVFSTSVCSVWSARSFSDSLGSLALVHRTVSACVSPDNGIQGLFCHVSARKFNVEVSECCSVFFKTLMFLSVLGVCVVSKSSLTCVCCIDVCCECSVWFTFTSDASVYELMCCTVKL